MKLSFTWNAYDQCHHSGRSGDNSGSACISLGQGFAAAPCEYRQDQTQTESGYQDCRDIAYHGRQKNSLLQGDHRAST